ncbi:hypothetical protein C8F04DRAFT_1294348 [Mycena alexandri]|uniref:Uncharacterized protein n=1 Tax=Mycena alexandri TaxID=1745969 RepID=A0AAD6SIF9_9AGAR|nr:hypothetical protein C8F04DRAFT_1294348 [Mycena alexandri]
MNHILSQDTFDAQPITAPVVHAVVHITQERGTGRVRSFVGDISPPPVLGTKWAAASRSRKYSRKRMQGRRNRLKEAAARRRGSLVDFPLWPASLCRREASAKVLFMEAGRKKRDERQGAKMQGKRGGGRRCLVRATHQVRICDENARSAQRKLRAHYTRHHPLAQEEQQACGARGRSRNQPRVAYGPRRAYRSTRRRPDAAPASQCKIASSQEEHGAVQIKREIKTKRDTHVDGRGGDGRMAATSRISMTFSQRNGRPQRGSREKAFEAALSLEYATHEPKAHRAFGVNRPQPPHPASTAHGARRMSTCGRTRGFGAASHRLPVCCFSPSGKSEILDEAQSGSKGLLRLTATQRTADETPSRRVVSSSPRGSEERLSKEHAHLHVRHRRRIGTPSASVSTSGFVAHREIYGNSKREGHVPMIHMLGLAYRARASLRCMFAEGVVSRNEGKTTRRLRGQKAYNAGRHAGGSNGPVNEHNGSITT